MWFRQKGGRPPIHSMVVLSSSSSFFLHLLIIRPHALLLHDGHNLLHHSWIFGPLVCRAQLTEVETGVPVVWTNLDSNSSGWASTRTVTVRKEPLLPWEQNCAYHFSSSTATGAASTSMGAEPTAMFARTRGADDGRRKGGREGSLLVKRELVLPEAELP